MEPINTPNQPAPNTSAPNPIVQDPSAPINMPLNIYERLMYLFVNGLLSSAVIYLYFIIFESNFSNIPLLAIIVVLFFTVPMAIYLAIDKSKLKNDKIIKEEASFIAISFIFPLVVSIYDATTCDGKFCELLNPLLIAIACVPCFVLAYIYTLLAKRPSKLFPYIILVVVSGLIIYYLR